MRLGRSSRNFVIGLTAAVVLGLLTWAFVKGIAICPSNQPARAQCYDEAHDIALSAATVVSVFVILATTAIVLLKRGRKD